MWYNICHDATIRCFTADVYRGFFMGENVPKKISRRERVNRIKTAILIVAFGMILTSLTMNIILLIRVMELSRLVQQIYHF